MSEIMRPLPFASLVKMIQGEYRNSGSAFGIRAEKFYRNQSGKENWTSLFGARLASPVGPAAGPNSQLAQNIFAAYLAGARFMELKTVQIMDGEELRKCVPRPCINTVDEGYNVEWSTELTVQEAFDEYVKAWFLLHLYGKEFELGGPDFAFNMSVGYNYDGITSPKIDAYIEGMRDASKTPVWKACRDWIAAHLGEFTRFTQADLDAISPAVSTSITLSTLHGCPREEIEKIAAYLLREKHIHTYIKCNPTLLGYESARAILDRMGYHYIAFDDHHFKDDLQFGDAVAMIGRLRETAKQAGLAFGVKITNTFPVDIKRGELPGNEMYMSGRSLFPLSITVARRLSEAFNGELPISYSGGADFFNLASILETGIRPVTVATTILKPGGYERLAQLAAIAEEVYGKSGGAKNGAAVDVKKLAALADSLPSLARYTKRYRHTASRKTASALPLFDCFKAPCKDGGCPLNQRIPEYLARVAAGDYDGAFAIIAADNTAPSVTGTICDHQCQNKCARVDYEDALEIRRAKLAAADNAEERFIGNVKAAALKTDKRVAVVGAGPGGVAAALYLRRNGVPVTVYEKRENAYGIVRHVIPEFRITDAAIERDYRLALRHGVEFKFGVEVKDIAEMRKQYAFVVLATGAWKEGANPVKDGKTIDALAFLEQSKKSRLALDLGKSVAVIGGGDVAMDCARAAKRNRGVSKVTIVYRRTRDFMPAQDEEIDLALADGVEIIELLAPLTFVDGALTCEVQRLGDYDASGRRGIVGTGEKRTLRFDTVIGAVGARVDTDFFRANGLPQNEKGYPVLNAANESPVGGVYVAGDCKAGAATVVKAIADSKIIARDILSKLGIGADFDAAPRDDAPEIADLVFKKGVVSPAREDSADAFRCLSCETLCELCVDVCPNRANVSVVDAAGRRQVVHIDQMCNECGNCAHFCPHAGRPYQDKFTLFSTEEDFNHSENQGVLFTGAGVKARVRDGVDRARFDALAEAARGLL